MPKEKMICEVDFYEPPKTAEEKVGDSEGGSLNSGLAMQTEMHDEYDYQRHPWHKQQHGTTRGD